MKDAAIICVDEASHKMLSTALDRKLEGGEPVPTHEEQHSERHDLTVISLYGVTVFVACLTDNLGAIFDYIGAFALSGH